MKITTELFSMPGVAQWIIENVGIENIKYDSDIETLEFLNDEDAITFRLKFSL